MKYLDLETSKYLVSLGCTSESENSYPPEAMGYFECPYCGINTPHYHRTERDAEGDRTCFICCREHGDWKENDSNFLCPFHGGRPLYKFHGNGIPMFSLEDILRKDNAVKIGKASSWNEFWTFEIGVLTTFQTYPDTWPEEVKKIIMS